MPTDDRRGLVRHRTRLKARSRRDRRLHRDAARGHRARASSRRAARCARSSPRSRRYTSRQGFFATFAATAAPAEGQLPASLARELGGQRQRRARRLRRPRRSSSSGELAPAAGEKDAVGRELYALQSRRFLGATIDLDETYEWGVEELARMVAEQESIAHEIKAGACVEEAVAFLDGDPSRKLHGTDALQRWMQETSDRAVAELGETHFDIPEPIRTLECMIAPTKEGGIYYTGPTDDFSRPGRMWWSVPEGVDRVRHLARAHDRLPRGRPGAPPADRAGGLQPRAS